MTARPSIRTSRPRLAVTGLALAALVAATPASAAPAAGPGSVTTGTRGSADWTVLGGNGGTGWDGFTDGADAAAITLADPGSAAVAPDGSTYLTNGLRDEVVRIEGGKAYRVAGGGGAAPADGADARSVDLDEPAVDLGPDGTVTLTSGDDVFALTAEGALDEVPWAYPADLPHNGQANLIRIDVDQLGRVLVLDGTTNAVLQIEGDGTATRLAGGGTAEPKNGGTAAATNLGRVTDVAGAPGGEIYLVGSYAGFQAVWRVGTDGKLKLHAGNPYGGWPTCSPAPQMTLDDPVTVATDSFGRVYVGNHGGVTKIRGDSQQQHLGSSTEPSRDVLSVAIGPKDELVTADSDGRVRRSPFVAERENGCRAFPYRETYQQIAAQKLVDAQAVRFHATIPSAERYEWADLIYRTTLDPSDLVVELSHRPAFAGPVGGTSRLYLATFGRPADTSGLRYWSGKRFSGTSLSSIATTFTRSSEFVRTYGALGNAGFVDLIYRNVLGRPGDAGGRAYWIRKLDAGATRGSILVAFSESSEFVRKTSVRTEATLATFGLLGRAPSATEVTAWTNQLANGHNVSELVTWVWYSAEHANRVQKKLG
jgi:hypothetical protein